ncbi:MAG: hypothetical protein ACRDMH_13105 [Solirubrobacterales bacterium]
MNEPRVRAYRDATAVMTAIAEQRESHDGRSSRGPVTVRIPHASPAERSEGLFLELLRDYVEGLGGELEISVRFAGEAPIELVRPSKARSA